MPDVCKGAEHPWLATRAPHGTWDDAATVQMYMQWLGERLGYTSMDDWYKVITKDFRHNSGASLLQKHGRSLAVLEAVFPQYSWLPWRMSNAPKGTWKDKPTVRWYMQWLGERLGYSSMEDWYQVSAQDFADNHGSGLLSKHGHSPLAVLKAVFPQYSWLPWRMSNAPRGTWIDKPTVRWYMQWLGERLGYSSMEDWYQVSKQDFEDNHGSGLSGRHGDSPLAVLEAVFPQYSWLPWRMSTAPMGTWDEKPTVRWYMQWLGERLGYSSMEDWYQVSKQDFEDNHGSSLLPKHSSSPLAVLKAVFPQYSWLPWRMIRAPNGTWDDAHTVRWYMQWLGPRLCYSSTDDWYNVSLDDFLGNNGSGLLDKHGNSPLAVLEAVFGGTWLPWRMANAPNGTWDDEPTVSWYMQWLGQRLGYSSMEDWYNLTKDDLVTNCGSGLLPKHSSSPLAVLKAVFPQYSWLPWRMICAPHGTWDDVHTVRWYMQWLGPRLGYSSMEDWYNVTCDDFLGNSGSGLLDKHDGSPLAVLEAVFGGTWLPWRMTKAPNGTWGDESTVSWYMRWLGERLGYSTMEEWYQVLAEDFKTNSGSGLLDKHDGRPLKVLEAVFPQYSWLPAKFRRVGYSAVAIRWLSEREAADGVSIQHIRSGEEGEFNIPGTQYKVDGFCLATNTVYEFLGSFWHGDPSVYDALAYNLVLSKTHGQLYGDTMQRLANIAGKGFRVIFVWESDYRQGSPHSGIL